MALISRLALLGPESAEPEDFLGESLAVIFPDDVMVQHGDPDHALAWTSPHLPRPLHLALTEPPDRHDRYLFSHYLWNASLLLAELVEAGTLGVPLAAPSGLGAPPPPRPSGGSGSSSSSSSATGRSAGRRSDRAGGVGDAEKGEAGDDDAESGNGVPLPETRSDEAPANRQPREPEQEADVSIFSVRGKRVLELGAGTALPSLVASVAGAAGVAVTDYPSPIIVETLARNVAANAVAANSPLSPPAACPVEVHGHEWGDLSSPFAARNRGAFDRVMSCDCLWMPWQHANLRRSVGWFLAPGPEARAWVVAGFHTGRVQITAVLFKQSGRYDDTLKHPLPPFPPGHSPPKLRKTTNSGLVRRPFADPACSSSAVRDFFNAEALRADAGLEVERIWERDCDGVERGWVWDGGPEDVSVRKRWLVVAVLRRVRD
ncbi:hypothetical protein DL771_006042 [Monosporascus sp. 5C6A]|nr:hypothetical protein DL771_006042 [Monosporascus sp. 5C6A]